MATGVESQEPGRTTGIALEFTEPCSSPSVKLPKRIRKRLLETRTPPSAKEIEEKLKEADLRRQQFHDWLSNKARPKCRSSWFSQDGNLSERLDAKLNAAQQKRLAILMDAKMRLARHDEMRKAAKSDVEMRFEKEREELGTKVELRVQQAELNRKRLLKALHQRKSLVHERTAKSLSQRIIREEKSKEHAYASLHKKWASAEKRRFGLLEAEMLRARARVMQARRVARSVLHQREAERRKMRDQLESKLQRAKRQRAEYLRQRGSAHSLCQINWNKQGDHLSRQLARCWKQFMKSRKTTVALANAYEGLGINEKSVKLMPFEQLAIKIESDSAIQATKALLERLERRFKFSQANSSLENIDHLLKRLSTSPKRTERTNASKSAQGRKEPAKMSHGAMKSLRYPTRVVLCAYVILAHPDAVFSGHGDREFTLADSALKFIRAFELLIKIILDGSRDLTVPEPPPLSLKYDCEGQMESSLPLQSTFKSQLAVFDAAWCSYLYCFVVWKVKDAASLEEDLVKAACQLELSMMQKCRSVLGRDCGKLSHDMRAIQRQVTEDQMLLMEKVKYLSGDAGIQRMESALSDARSKFSRVKEHVPLYIAPSHLLSTAPITAADASRERRYQHGGAVERSQVVCCLFKDDVSAQQDSPGESSKENLPGYASLANEKSVAENILLVNEILHKSLFTSIDNLNDHAGDLDGIKQTIKETMERAFWDGILEPVKQGEQPDYGRIIQLVKEVRDELHKIAPQSKKQEIVENFDIDVLCKVLHSEACGEEFLRGIFEYALGILEELSAPAKATEMEQAHRNLLNEITDITESGSGMNSLFIASVKGLRFILEQIQVLKSDISNVKIKFMESLVRGAAGIEYLQSYFTGCYGPPSKAVSSLPLTSQWLKSMKESLQQEWEEHIDFLSATHCLPPAASIRAGGTTQVASKERQVPVLSLNHVEYQECGGEKVDTIVRLGLLKLVCSTQGLAEEILPETIKLNFVRLRSVQGKVQKIIVISICLLVLRQLLLGESSNWQSSVLDGIISNLAGRLWSLVECFPEAGITEIVGTISSLPSLNEHTNYIVNKETIKSRNMVLSSMLIKCLQEDDAVFLKVARAVYTSMRSLVLCSNSDRGRKQAEVSLLRVGAVVLTEKLATTAEILVRMAAITVQVHRPWYDCITKMY